MGCGASKEQIDFGKIEEEKARQNALAKKPVIEHSASLLEPATGFHAVDFVRASKAPLQHFMSQPKLVSQVKESAIAIINTNPNKGAHHLKNVFAAPLEDLGNFQAPVFLKVREEKVFIREALKNNFVFAALSQRELRTIIDAFERMEVHGGETLIQQGDAGDYFYIIREGKVRFDVGGNTVGRAFKGKSFGELALLYTSPRAASVIAESDTVLYRVDQKTFRYIMQSQTLQTENDKKDLLLGVAFLKTLEPSDINKLIHTMTPRKFAQGEYLCTKGEQGDVFYVIQEGKIRVTEITIGSTDYENQTIGPGDYFGERALVTKEPRSANCIGETEGIALCIDLETFEKVLGNLSVLTMKSEDKRKLAAIKMIQDSHLSQPSLAALVSLIRDRTFAPRSVIMEEGEQTSASLYLVRSGKVEIKNKDGTFNNIIDAGGYFGEDMLDIDVGGVKKSSARASLYTVTVLGGEVVTGVLSIDDCREIVDTTSLGCGKKAALISPTTTTQIPLNLVKKHAILGAGTFGQVWLVSHDDSDGIRHAYALKIQSKYELVQGHQDKGVVQEKNIMQQLNHPFLINLVQTYQDNRYVYMLLGIVQGGELYSLLHQSTYDGISERDAKFYAAAILEGLSYMHRRNILYRDMKPENVLIDNQGYPVIVDLGFAKYVPTKTYTLCGTPLYLAPEVILNRGHAKGADHWSYAVLIYEMIAGHTPFYTEGMDQISLFKTICKGDYQFPPAGIMTIEIEDLLQRFFVLDPAKRLGSLARGIDEIYAHLWYAEIDFADLRLKEIKPPWVPEIKNPLDKSNFENWDHLVDKTLLDDPPISDRHHKIFETF